MLPKIFASLLITFSVLAGTQATQVEKIDPFFSSDKMDRMRAELKADIINLSFFANKRAPEFPKIEASELPEAKNVPLPNLKIRAGLTASNGYVFYEKNINEPMSVASLTKLLTALVVLDNIDINHIAVVSKKAIDTYGDMGGLINGERLSIKNLLYIMLIDSSNDAAVALAEAVEQDGRNFLDLMNQKAKTLQMNNSQFTDPSGLNETNLSTAADLYKLTEASLKHPLIKEIMATEETDVLDASGTRNHHLKNTNKLLGKINNAAGGKTGYTEEAGECMILIVESPQNNSHFTAIVLGAGIGMRFIETEKLVRWTRYTYGW